MKLWLQLLTLIASLAAPAMASGAAAAPASAPFVWEQATPESVGMSSARLEALRAFLRTEQTAAMMVIVHGKVVFEYGNVTRPSKIASIRKSILAMLFGNAVAAGTIDMQRTVVDLGLQEKEPFLPYETHATLEDLLAARSGIYRDEETDDITKRQPRVGSEFPGTTFYYNNWEFDAAGTAYEKLTGRNIYDAFQTDLAAPLGMQDFRRELQHKFPSPGSVHPEYAMYLSTRDMARIGLLMLHLGNWDGRQILPADWVRYMTSIVTPWDEMNPFFMHLRGAPERWGFGLGWWVWDAAPYPGNLNVGPFQGAFMARGSGGQYIVIIPAKDMVVVHKVDLDAHPGLGTWMGDQDWDAILNLVIGSFCSGKCG